MSGDKDTVEQALHRVANAIMPDGMGRDANDGYVASLGESVMGVTGGLVKIADAISDLAAAIREREP